MSITITIPPNLIKRFFICLLLLVSLSDARPQIKANSHFIQVHIDSLHPQEDLPCKHSPTGKREGASLEVVHRHGPCSKLKSPHDSLSHFDLSLQLDQDRVDSIHARLSGQSVAGDKAQLDSSSATLPARSGSSIGSANYIVSVGLGTPQKELSLVFDTGSHLTWTQCKPCSLGSCYGQFDPMFDPTTSSSYGNISCNSPLCTGSCSSATCEYRISYGDKSSSVGFLAKERLTLTSSDFIDGFIFGCGENNRGFRGTAGLIGLGRSSLSLMSQAAAKYGRYFSYCLPPISSTSTGHLTLGQGGTTATSFSYTPLLTNSINPSFYSVDLQSISVGGQQLPISPSVFSASGTIIDSGTVISRLPQQAYSVLSAAFKQHMSKYPSVPSSGRFLDTCFDFSNYTTITIPVVTLNFAGGGVLVLPFKGIMYPPRPSTTRCLAFAPTSGGVGIVGNVQQQGFDVVYDVAGGRIGFGPNAC